MFLALPRVQLDEKAGVRCSDAGLRLAGVDLLTRTAAGFEPRPKVEVEALAFAAYGNRSLAEVLLRGVVTVARALNDNDVAKAMMIALYLRLPPLDTDGATRAAAVDEWFAKYSPDQPRDWHGRWTTEGGGSGPVAADSARPSTGGASTRNGMRVPTDLEGHSAPSTAPPFANDCDGLEGDNGPPDEPIEEPPTEPPRDPAFPTPKVPAGWDVAPGVRVPIHANGMPWPVGSHDAIQAILKQKPGGMAQMKLYVPIDGKGPILIGSNGSVEFEKPDGYDEVRLWGTPQVTYSRGEETGHAWDSIDQALRFAGTNQYSDIYFNRSFTVATQSYVVNPLRPDVIAMVRPELDMPYRIVPTESYSPGQDSAARARQMPVDPLIKPLDGRYYKMAFMRDEPYLIFIPRLELCL